MLKETWNDLKMKIIYICIIFLSHKFFNYFEINYFVNHNFKNSLQNILF
jgi:hypothetical protein